MLLTPGSWRDLLYLNDWFRAWTAWVAGEYIIGECSPGCVMDVDRIPPIGKDDVLIDHKAVIAVITHLQENAVGAIVMDDVLPDFGIREFIVQPKPR